MSKTVCIKLLPLGKTLIVDHGAPLHDVLFAHGVEFPCGGRGRCRGCKIKCVAGALPVMAQDERKLSAKEIAEGWRLACHSKAITDLTLELAQWEGAILSDESSFEFKPQDGLGVAVDLGTTTIVCQLLDMRTGDVLGVQAAFNAQSRHGSDIMSRIEFACAGGANELTRLVREQIGAMIDQLLSAAKSDMSLKSVVIAGNTVMHHLFSGISVKPLAHHPFEPVNDGLQRFRARQLGWTIEEDPPVRFLPCLGGFVGSDLLAGILATKIHKSSSPLALIDLGTNGEIVLGNHSKILCASTAAGPAFEGGQISMGMRATTGAIWSVKRHSAGLGCQVLGNVEPRGICGSGLVDAVAAGLDEGVIMPSGRFSAVGDWLLASPVKLTQHDIRKFQLAKGAIAAGLRILAQQWPMPPGDIQKVYLAGAFGNYVRNASARRVGLIDFPAEKVQPSGNTALLGCKIALLSLGEGDGAYSELRKICRHVSLAEDSLFHEIYANEMQFSANLTQENQP